MKFKSNRKRRSTRKTRQCKRIKNRRTRRQRGGLKKAEVLHDVLIDYLRNKNDPLITHHFGSHDAFEKLLSSRDPVNLKYLCNDTTTEGTIRTTEFLFANQIAKGLIPKIPKIPNVETRWPDFVVHLKKVVESQYTKRNHADIERHLFDLKFPTSNAAKERAAAAAAAAAPLSAAAARPSSTVVAAAAAQKSADTLREVAPPGWTQIGNVWAGPNGDRRPQDYFRYETNDELIARLEAALKDD
jgi:hypothetical protein